MLIAIIIINKTNMLPFSIIIFVIFQTLNFFFLFFLLYFLNYRIHSRHGNISFSIYHYLWQMIINRTKEILMIIILDIVRHIFYHNQFNIMFQFLFAYCKRLKRTKKIMNIKNVYFWFSFSNSSNLIITNQKAIKVSTFKSITQYNTWIILLKWVGR